ncbi:GNAT family N-acetyltransferase [Eikenella sp. S3360]|uniref:GNAT family N-acetyltransferase n=1 Tax=Eikenella glucosivorans TaxID=2766967 RepID=A0ABS0N998_9NEIS|nr:GNAT family N-acetyltransferase [Eikenella glucosivorans]MBH5328887.1 GNAT family N-acetyltransferase [Eikenella glucosivorans]
MITIQACNSAEHRQTILSRLKAYNQAHSPWLAAHPDTAPEQADFLAFDGGTLAGGIIGAVAYNWYALDLLYVGAAYRRQGLGSRLLGQAETFARHRGLTGIRLETWRFQAKDFYLKNGYRIFAELPDCPPGTTVYFMSKTL